MAEQVTTAVTTKQKTHLPPFEIEFATENSTGVMYPPLTGRKFRGRWSKTKLAGSETSLGADMAMMPDIPGQRMRIIPKECKIVVSDPLETDKKLVRQVTTVYSRAVVGWHKNFTPVPKSEEVLDQDTFKTLLIWMRRCLDGPNPNFVVASGEFPTMDQINGLDGDELNEPGSTYATKGPKYKKDRDRHKLLVEAMAEKGIVI